MQISLFIFSGKQTEAFRGGITLCQKSFKSTPAFKNEHFKKKNEHF